MAKATRFKFSMHIHRVNQIKRASKEFGKNINRRSQGVSKTFKALMYGAHHVVIFAIAQLSCRFSHRTCCSLVMTLWRRCALYAVKFLFQLYAAPSRRPTAKCYSSVVSLCLSVCLSICLSFSPVLNSKTKTQKVQNWRESRP